MISRILQRLRSQCEFIVARYPWMAPIAVGVFALAANLSASAIWDAVNIWGMPWDFAPLRISYVLLFAISISFLYFIAPPLFSIHATHKPAERRKHLILFLSWLGGNDDRQKTLAKTNGIYEWLLPQLSLDNLTQDLKMMAVIKEEDEKDKRSPKRSWPWEMPLRAIHWHRKGGVLQSVSIVCSAESMKQVFWFLEVCRKYPDLNGIDFNVVDKREGQPYLLRESSNAPLDFTAGWNFEDFDDLKGCLQGHLANLYRVGLKDQDIMIDFTGGQKVTSVAATFMTLNRPLKAQYVQTNSPYKALEYDLYLVIADRGKIGT